MSDQQAVAWMYVSSGNLVQFHHSRRHGLTSLGYAETPLYATPKSSEGELLDGAVTALQAAETLYLNGILNTPNEEIDRVHALRRAVLAKAEKVRP